MLSRCQKCTKYKPSLHRLKHILNCHYVVACMYVYLETHHVLTNMFYQQSYYHCLLVSLWKLISVIPNDSLDFSVCKRRKMILGFHLGMEAMLILKPSSSELHVKTLGCIWPIFSQSIRQNV